MKLSNKKGFTIVELVVVVAVIAILAAVLIPTVSGIIAKARLNADQQAVSNMNKAVAEAVAVEEFANAGEAVDALYAYGFNNGKLETYSTGYHYAFDFENSKFYLLDEEGEVVFPEKSEDVVVADLWGFFNNSKADVIAGVTKYIALSGIADEATFYGADCVIANETDQYTIDLNNRYIGITGKANVKVVNGTVKKDSGFLLGTDAVEKAVYVTTSTTNVTGEVKDVVITSASSKTLKTTDASAVVFKNVTLDFTAGGNNATVTLQGASSYTFENCVINMNDANVFIRSTGSTDITFKNCTLSSGRGIVIGPAKNGAVGYGDIVFEGNTFVCTNQTLNRPFIQFASASNAATPNTLNVDSIVIKDNVFECSDIAIRIHETLLTLNCSTITLTGNTFNEKAVKIDGDGNSVAQAIADTWIFE